MKSQVTLCTALVVGTLAAPVWAEANRLQPDFTFRRVTVPPSDSGARITVQIAPQAPSGPAAPARAGEDAASTAGAAPASAPQISGLEWFWLAVSPKIEDSRPGRLALALREIANAPQGRAVPAPRMQTMTEIAGLHGIDILRETVGTNVSPALVLAVIAVESAGRVDAESSAGAQGLMQLMPRTAARFGVTDSLDPTDNIKGGVAYLDWLMGEFDRDPILVLAGYNAGEGAVRTHEGVPPYAETRVYVPKVLAAWQIARGLCMTPPELVTDGCVFSVSGG
jgi:soluble lytic murein transglycosylase-like protein